MAQRIEIPIGYDSYESASNPFSISRCINLYAVAAQSEAKTPVALFGTPGTNQLGTAGAGASRGAFVMDGVYYVVTGTSLYSMDKFGNAILHGTISGTARCSMAGNGEKLVIVVPGGNAYQYNKTPNTLVDITGTANWQVSDTVVYKDGYYIFSASDGVQFFNSNLSVGSSADLVFDALDFGTAELKPDKIVGLHASSDYLYVLGEETTEVFQNVGGAGFPFQRIDGASYEKGCYSKYTPIQWEGAFYFIGGGINEGASIWMAGGSGEPQRVSTNAIDYQIQKFTSTELKDAFSFSYSLRGNSFIGFTIRSVNTDSKTFVYNVTASKALERPIWFEQQTGVGSDAWRANSVHSAYSKLLVSDAVDGRIGILDPDVYTEYGDTIMREKVTSPLDTKGVPLFVSEMDLSAETGVGLITGQGSEPLIIMTYSDDGGKTWSSESLRSMGRIGEYKKRIIWRRQGRIPWHRVFKFRITDPVKVVLYKLELEVVSGG